MVLPNEALFTNIGISIFMIPWSRTETCEVPHKCVRVLNTCLYVARDCVRLHVLDPYAELSVLCSRW